MMKKILISIVLFVTCFACSRDDIMVYSGDSRAIYFEKFYMNAIAPGTEGADSTLTSFFFYPDGTQYIYADLVVNLSGKVPTSDVHFGLKVIPEGTTANTDEYFLEDEYTFHAQAVTEDQLELKDTIQVKLIYNERLDDMPEGVRLELELVPSEGLELGQVERRRAIVIVTSQPVRPDWWVEGGEVEEGLLGPYSVKKYKLFLNNADIHSEMSLELLENHPDEARKLALKFKEWLGKQDIETITDEDGSIISVKI